MPLPPLRATATASAASTLSTARRWYRLHWPHRRLPVQRNQAPHGAHHRGRHRVNSARPRRRHECDASIVSITRFPAADDAREHLEGRRREPVAQRRGERQPRPNAQVCDGGQPMGLHQSTRIRDSLHASVEVRQRIRPAGDMHDLGRAGDRVDWNTGYTVRPGTDVSVGVLQHARQCSLRSSTRHVHTAEIRFGGISLDCGRRSRHKGRVSRRPRLFGFHDGARFGSRQKVRQSWRQICIHVPALRSTRSRTMGDGVGVGRDDGVPEDTSKPAPSFAVRHGQHVRELVGRTTLGRHMRPNHTNGDTGLYERRTKGPMSTELWSLHRPTEFVWVSASTCQATSSYP